MTAALSPFHAWFRHDHVREDAACSSPHPHPAPLLAGQQQQQQQQQQQHVRQPHYSADLHSQPQAPQHATKRKRADSIDPAPVKFPKVDSAADAAADAVHAHRPPSLPAAANHHDVAAPLDAVSTVAVAHDHACSAPVATVSSQPLVAPASVDTPLSHLDSAQASSDMSLSCTSAVPPKPGMSAPAPALSAQDAHANVALCEDAMDVDVTPVIVTEADRAAAETKAKNSVLDNISIFLCTQVLFKQKELRLIETEQAKCQIALEQLRRCRAIPYPGQPSSSAPANHIITGTGPALEVLPGLPKPRYPAPFGATDGPYTRHYSRWLIPDPAFDVSPPRAPRISVPTPHAVSRKLKPIDDPAAPKKRSSNAGFEQIPAPASNFRDGKGRLIVKNDQGEYVKIICKVCHKGDSSNIQGFVNHTRIAHNLVYVSHVEAVKDCSQPLDDTERDIANQIASKVALQTPPEEHQQARRRHINLPPVSATPTPMAPICKPLLTPLLTGPSRQSLAGQSLHASSVSLPRVNGGVASNVRKNPPPALAVQAPFADSAKFVPSSTTPALSNLLQKLGYKLDLEEQVTAAKTKIDLDSIQPYISDSDMDQDTPVNSKHTGARTGARMVKDGAPASRMPARAPSASLAGSPMHASTPSGSDASIIPDSFMTDATALIPSARSSFASGSHGAAVVDSSQVSPRTADDPGMVTDDDDFDDDARSSYHGDGMSHDGDSESVDFTVRDEDSEVTLGHFHPVEHTNEPCVNTPHTEAFFPTFGTPQGEKKKRGRPRKNL